MDCEFDHMCTSDCGKHRECPCDSDHWCSNSPEHDSSECEDADEPCPVHAKIESGVDIFKPIQTLINSSFLSKK